MRGASGVVTVAVALAGAALVGLPAAARADDRPSEDAMFGSAPAASAPPAKSAAPAGGQSPDGGAPAGDGGAGAAATGQGGAPAQSPPAPPAGPVSLQPSLSSSSPAEPGGQPASRDEALLGDPSAGPKLSAETAPEDPLKIGGQIYFRALAQATQGQVPGDARFSAPALVDGYFDARPNDRVRGFVLGRLLFDPTLPSTTMATTSGNMTGSTTGTGGTVATPTVPLLSGTQATRGPSAVLDQLWLRFDIKRTVFVTAGRQHVKWGTARFWTPTDFLHPLRRNPVAAFDARPGFTMVKLHLPWEERGWNLYGFGLVEGVNTLDNATGRPVDGSDKLPTVGQIGGALRAEVVVGTSEWGLGGVFYRDQKPRFGGDVSFGIGDFDLYADAGFRYGSEIPRRGYNPADVPFTLPATGTQAALTLSVNDWVDQKYPLYYSSGIKPQITAGGTYSLRYNDNDVFTVTGEYFYNSRGYDDPHVYPGLFLTNTFEFFYTGKHYAALGAIAAAPWSWNYTTFSLTTLGNLSDQSFITRLDYSLTMLTHLRFEAFGAVNYGRRTGEFRLGVDGFMLPGGSTFSLQPQAFSVGLGLRISI